jgi:iron complex transport system substrate-binding protein
VLSLEPHGLGDVFDDILRVGAAVGRDVEAKELVAALQARVERVRVAAAHDDRGRLDGHRPRVLCLEWLEPLYQGGHWVPEMVELAGGEPVLATAGGKSVRLAWEDVLAADPEVVVLMPCGYHLRETVEQYEALRGDFPAGWRNATAMRQGRIYAVDGSAYFSRPGPRLVEGLEILRTIIAGGDLEGLPAASVLRVAGSSLR